VKASGPAAGAARVLIVDDNELNFELAAFVLQAAGFEVDGATQAHEVGERVTRFRPDLILMDIRLGESDGLALARALKQAPATQHICIVAFTAFAMAGDEARMRAAGCDGYIAKPIDVTHFAQQVRACLWPAGAVPAGTPVQASACPSAQTSPLRRPTR
jgi:two-component system, cell cycle response regulator DivK